MQDILRLLRSFGGRKVRFAERGENVQLARGSRFFNPERISIADHVYIGPGAVVNGLGGVQIGRGTIVGPRLTVYSADHVFRDASAIPYDERIERKAVRIGENVWIGGDVIVVPGTVIGEGCIVGAGSVVSGEVAPLSIVVGNPARVVSTRDAEHYRELKAADRVYLKLKRAGILRPDY